MDQQTEKLQDSEKKASHKSWSARKKRAILVVIAAALALLVIPVFAWLYMQRSMETITKVNMPYALLIGAGDAKPIQQLELSNIDVSGTQKYKDVVFCVYSEKPSKSYYLSWHIQQILDLNMRFIKHHGLQQMHPQKMW